MPNVLVIPLHLSSDVIFGQHPQGFGLVFINPMHEKEGRRSF
jgi:hypothetical protein